MSGPPVTVARADSAAGEVVLRRRGGTVELIVGGVFVMDTVDVSTEVELATRTLARHPRPARVLVGGLGLGFTVEALLADARVEQVVVVEIAEPLVEWAGQGLLPARGLRDPRVGFRAGDVGAALRASPGEWDLVLLDVDNGPGFLVRQENAELYARAGLRAAVASLRPGGILAIWSSHRAPELLGALEALGAGTVEEILRTVRREGREFDYAIYLTARDGGGRTDLSTPHTPE
ncbi:MAG: spermidine synthase [Dermatophilaceae bacterium]